MIRLIYKNLPGSIKYLKSVRMDLIIVLKCICLRLPEMKGENV